MEEVILPPLRGVLGRDLQFVGKYVGGDGRWRETDDGTGAMLGLPGPARAFMAVVLPAPAGPTSTSTIRPDTVIPDKASAWSSPSIRPSASGLRAICSTVVSLTVGPVSKLARSSSLSSAKK